jgi:NTE family protein
MPPKQTSSSAHADSPKVGLVLGSGGSRGIVHIPILESLRDLGIPIDLIAGSSIGAVVAGIYAVGTLEKLRLDLNSMKIDVFLKLFDPALSRSGLFAGRKAMVFLNQYIPRQTRIEDLPIPLGIVATDYDSGHPVVFRNGNLLEAIRASVSIPGVFMPARFGGALLVDGGVADPLPIDVAEDMGADLTIAVSLHPAIGRLGLIPFKSPGRGRHRASPALSKVPPMEKIVRNLIASGRGEGWLKAADQWLDSRRVAAEKRRALPNLFEIIARTIDIMEYTETLLMLASHPPTVLIDFNFPDIGTLDFTMSSFLIDEGLKAFNAKKKEIIEKIGRSPHIRNSNSLRRP